METKEFVVSFRVNRNELQNLKLLVDESGLSLSNLVRDLLNLGAGGRRRIPHMRS
jgi:hypothetical protein